MKNNDRIMPFETTNTTTEFGILTTLSGENGISAKDSISFNGKSLLANYIYDSEGGYNLVYTAIDILGNEESFKEDDGILPSLFLSPELENYASVVPYHPDKELEISIPIFNRESSELPKGNRPFKGDFIGVSSQYSIFFESDMWSDTKPDKLLSMEFKNGLIKKKHNIKIPLPRNNKIFINDNEIHLLSLHENGWLHRQIDEKGKELQKRIFKPTTNFIKQILSLSFENDSYVLCGKDGKVNIETITSDGSCSSQEIADINDSYYNTWQPVAIGEKTFVTRFNGEFGNGWLTIKEDKLVEFFYSKDVEGFKELISNKLLHIPKDNLVISSINKTGNNNYAVIFYPMTDRGVENKKIVVLNRALKK